MDEIYQRSVLVGMRVCVCEQQAHLYQLIGLKGACVCSCAMSKCVYPSVCSEGHVIFTVIGSEDEGLMRLSSSLRVLHAGFCFASCVCVCVSVFVCLYFYLCHTSKRRSSLRFRVRVRVQVKVRVRVQDEGVRVNMCFAPPSLPRQRRSRPPVARVQFSPRNPGSVTRPWA